jgi:hypothetical protein
MKRIEPWVKDIADAHIKARIKDSFDNPPITTKREVIESLVSGLTMDEVMKQVEIRFCSITSTLIMRQFKEPTKAYKAGIYKGFKILLQTQ